AAQAAITCRNAVSTRISNRRWRTTLPNERESLNSSTNSTIRGLGLHHRTGWPPLYQGKMPCRYASSRRSGDRSPPAASNPFGSSSAASIGGKRELDRNHWTTGAFCRDGRLGSSDNSAGWKPRMSEPRRCDWAGTDPRMIAYHDQEWGTPVH